MKGFFFGFATERVPVLERSSADTIDRPVGGFALFRRGAFFAQCWCEVRRAFFRLRSRFFGGNASPRAGAARGGKYPFLSRRIFPRGFFFYRRSAGAARGGKYPFLPRGIFRQISSVAMDSAATTGAFRGEISLVSKGVFFREIPRI